ncbi:hypothetical protein BKA64DRAFT_707475 [Cadophora sp. MPI-SDFR-AT-0126]|nr:hypothetical protein BKA64DRAFT_707475 [Leotiomycetes sp. MPI-SDFR-AT-0126]
MEDETFNSGDDNYQQTHTETPRKVNCPRSSSLDHGLPSRAVHPISSQQATRSSSQRSISPDLDVESNATNGQGGTWDDDFEEVDDEAFDPATHQDEQSEEEEEDEGFDGDEETYYEEAVAVYTCLKDKEMTGNGGGDVDEAIASVEREDCDGGEDECVKKIERRQMGEEDPERIGKQDEDEKDERRLERSMSPSPQPPPPDG